MIYITKVLKLTFLFQVHNIVKCLELGDEVYQQICDILLSEMKKGLGQATNETAAVKMFPSYVRSLPNGKGMDTLFISILSFSV